MVPDQSLIPKINEHLPPEIRVIGESPCTKKVWFPQYSLSAPQWGGIVCRKWFLLTCKGFSICPDTVRDWLTHQDQGSTWNNSLLMSRHCSTKQISLGISKVKKHIIFAIHILTKMENKKECYHYLSLNHFPKMKIVPAKQSICDQVSQMKKKKNPGLYLFECPKYSYKIQLCMYCIVQHYLQFPWKRCKHHNIMLHIISHF